ncbi:MAG: spore maturation protein [Bacillota bacterium]|nr:spore maturation protein [Bacillota bacterium]
MGFLTAISYWTLFLFIGGVLLVAYLRRVNVYQAFLEGAAEGFALGIRLLPYIVGIFVAVSVFREGGALLWLTQLLAPALNTLGVPPPVFPLLLVRPMSGPASLGLVLEIFTQEGVDSLAGRSAAAAYGCTETTLYVLALYFASVGVKRPRYSVAVGLLADLAGFLAAVWICRALFG